MSRCVLSWIRKHYSAFGSSVKTSAMHPAIVLGACSRRGFFEVLKFLLAIFEGTGGAAEDDAAVIYGGKSGESGRWEDGPGGERETDICRCRERCQPQ